MSFFKKNISKMIIVIVFSLCMAVLCRVYAELKSWYEIFGADMNIVPMLRFVFVNWQFWLMFLIICAVASVFVFNEGVRNFVYKYRYPLSFIAFMGCVIFGITGSSIGSLCDIYGLEDKELIFGFSRIIRTDEYCVSTPFFVGQSLSESVNSYDYFSDFANGIETDLFMGVRQPIKHVLAVFRPFTLGFLFLSPERALSFWWCGKLIVLFLVTFEMGMLLTGKRKTLSLIMSLLITFSPTVQWWFSTTAGEIIIYTEIAMLMFNKYLSEKRLWIRMILLVGILYSAGCFIMLLYPAWQVPFVYVILALTVWIIIKNKDKIILKWYDYVSIATGVVGLALVFVYIFKTSEEAFNLISNTVYPGARLETGGEWGGFIFFYPFNIWDTITGFEIGTHNVCERTGIYDFFPLSFCLPIMAMINNKKKDLLTIILLCLNVFFGIWIIWGFPEIIAKITFLSNSQANRTLFAWGFVNVILLIRGASLMKGTFNIIKAIIINIVLSAIVVPFIVNISSGKINKKFDMDVYVAVIAGTFLLVALGMFCFINYNRKNMSLISVCTITVIVMISGIMVNPVRAGIDSVYEEPLIKAIDCVDSDNTNDIWVIECSGSTGYQFVNMGLLTGVKVFNSTQVYPNMELWSSLDSNGQYEDIYNRYAHIGIVIKESGAPEFELFAVDSFTLRITFQDLKQLGVSYVVSRNNLDECIKTSECNVENIYNKDNVFVYKIN